MNQLPVELAHIISDYVAIWTILPWVNEIEDTIKLQHVGGQPPDRVCTKKFYLSMNPMAFDALDDIKKCCPISLTCNAEDWAFDMIMPHLGEYELGVTDFINNTNPRAIALVEKHIAFITPGSWSSILRNPAAIELIKKYDGLSKATYPEQIYWNDSEATWDLIKDRYKMDMTNGVLYVALSYNSSSWAKRLVDENNIQHDDPRFDKLDSKAIKNLISNVGISNLEDQDWIAVCSNPCAIDILREHPDNIWEDIWANPAIFEPTRRPGVLNILTELTW